MKVRHRLLLGLLLALVQLPLLATSASAASAGAAGGYQVEVVIFRALNSAASEDLAVPAEGRGFGGQLDRGTAAPHLLRKLDASQMQLGGVAARLRSSGAYQVLAHAAWVQTATDWPHHGALGLEDLGITVPGLSGGFYLERGPQLLHFGMELHLGGSPSWSLSELRKVKFNDKNYFDHPGFGVIAIVSQARHGEP